MKCSKSFIVTAAALIIAALFVWSRISGIDNGLMTPGEGARVWMLTHHQYQAVTNNPASQPPPARSNQALHDLGFRQNANELSNGEKAELTNSFVTKP
jgi:hypothetical protein